MSSDWLTRDSDWLMYSLTTGKSLLFLYNITRDNVNIRQTCNLIFSLTRHNPGLAEQVGSDWLIIILT